MELPLHTRDGVSHPGLECANFDVTEGQTGDVWFLAAPFSDCTRAATIPSGKSLFIALLDSEWSNVSFLQCLSRYCPSGVEMALTGGPRLYFE